MADPDAPGPYYLNARIQGAPEPRLISAEPAITNVTRSGSVVEPAREYYVSVHRLAFSYDAPLMVAPVLFPQFTADGVTTRWQITIRYTDVALTEFYGSSFLQLLPDGAPVLGQTTQPSDLSAAIWTQKDFVTILNNAVATAYAACDAAAGGGVLPSQVPFFSEVPNGGGLLRLTVFPFSFWDQGSRQPGIAPFLDIGFPYEVQPIFSGFALRLERRIGQPVSPNAFDYAFIIRSDGYNYAPANAAGSESITPTTATNSVTMIVNQLFVTQTYPGIVKISLLSSLPSLSEYTPAIAGTTNDSERILTDFALDTSAAARGGTQQSFVYNASFGNCRWARLTGKQPIQHFVLNLATTDWLGEQRPLSLFNPSEAADVKLCFAPRKMVESAPPS